MDNTDLARRAYQTLYQAARQAKSRQKRDATPHPAPDDIIAARLSTGLTQGDAAAIVYTTDRHWSNWERGVSKMPRSSWRLFRLLTGLETLPAISSQKNI
jgi:DNA-binding transcriptional regulator YiaG